MPSSLPPVQQQQQKKKYLRPTDCPITFLLHHKLDIVQLGHRSCALCIHMPQNQTRTHSHQGTAWGLNTCNHTVNTQLTVQYVDTEINKIDSHLKTKMLWSVYLRRATATASTVHTFTISP